MANHLTAYVEFLGLPGCGKSFISHKVAESLRREGVKVNVSELKEMFTQELSTVRVNGMALSEEQKATINEVVFSLLEII